LSLYKISELNFNENQIEGLYSKLPEKVIIKDEHNFNPEIIVGCDVSYREKAVASCVAWNIQRRRIEKELTKRMDIPADYIPGRFVLRELPLLVKIISKLTLKFDCLILDGHGIAHPEKAGLASFAGVLFNLPTVGCTKNILVGEYELPDLKKGQYSDIVYNSEKVGEVLCTRDNTKPIFISPGHLISFKTARKLILKLAINSKYPEPLRLADINSRKFSL
jgi:deoxyribonuclease V